MESEKFLSNGKVDFSRKSLFRDYPIQVSDATFFVNPFVLSQASPVLKVMVLDEQFLEKRNFKACLEDETPDDIRTFLEAVCPTHYGVYPEIVTEETFPILARLADKFLVDALRVGCEDFVVKCHYTSPSANVLMKMLVACCSYNFRAEYKKILLRQLLEIKKERFVINDDLKQTEVGRIVHHEISKGRYPQHFVVHSGDVSRCRTCRTGLNFTAFRCTRCGARMCLSCSGSVCHRVLSSRVKRVFSLIKSC